MGLLILIPHMDDEVLGCASFLQDEGLHLCYVTHVHPAFPDGVTVGENEALINWLGEPDVTRLMMGANLLDIVPSHNLFSRFEKVINAVQPDTALIPHPGFNQDHRAVYEAALTAMRPHDTNHLVKRILLYEHLSDLSTLRKVEPFRPTYFRSVNVSYKLAAFQFYKSQHRAHRTEEQIDALAKVRGHQCGMGTAEAFEVVRWIE